MTLNHVLCFVVSLLLTAGIAFAQQPSPPTPELPSEAFRSFSLLVDGGGYLGVYIEEINKDKLSQYGLSAARGVGITEVVKGSPAEKAGLRKGDVILRFDNEPVTSVRKLNRLVAEVAPDHTVALSVSRGGAEQELSVTIGSRQDYSSSSLKDLQGRLRGLMNTPDAWKLEMPESATTLVYALGNNRRIGISTTTLTKQLADFFGVPDGKGVLITSVEADSPAAKAGLKAGDVIIAIDDAKTESAGDLSRGINKQTDGEVTLTLVRDKSQRTVKVTPKAGSGTLIQPGTPEGTLPRIVLPQIELESIPAMNLVLPRIALPTIPAINVVVPKVPPVRVVKSGRVVI